MAAQDNITDGNLKRSSSTSEASETPQTAQDYIASQLSLEADAREALPYQFDTCTQPLGPLRQSIYACLTCAPPPASKYQHYNPAGVCYSCSISCHGEHNLVELFSKRDFVCDCGTTRLANSGTPCSLRTNAATGRKGNVKDEEPRAGNKYNQNFKGKFCGCGEEYDPEIEKGTMFQCLGLGHVQDGGCGEDWWHPECLMGLPRRKLSSKPASGGELETVKGDAADDQPSTADGDRQEIAGEDDTPPGFPSEDDFDHIICYKCSNAFPWIRQYAGTAGFLHAIKADVNVLETNEHAPDAPAQPSEESTDSNKRKAEDELERSRDSSKRAKSDSDSSARTTANPMQTSAAAQRPKHECLPPTLTGPISLFLKEDFRDHLCRCADCFPHLAKHPQLLDEEETYEPPVSESNHNNDGSIAGRSVGSGSLLDRGEAALSSMDHVRAIEGVMAYNHVRDKVKAFLQPFAQSGQPVGAEDIKAYFAKLRGDEQAMREAAVGAENGGAFQGDGRKEQDGY